VTLYEDLQARTDVTRALVSELERVLGSEASLSVGTPGTSLSELGESRAVLVNATLDDGTALLVALTALPEFAAKLEHAAEDELLPTAVGPALAQGVDAIASVAESETDAAHPYEVDVQTIESVEDATLVYPILDGDIPVGAVVVVIVPAADPATSSPGPTTAAREHPMVEHGAGPVLADVTMGITAELGRSTVTIRDLLSIAPGAVIDLDRAATAPVDILVNGTVIARGEVVVIDEEFGVRILEIIGRDAEHSSVAQP
jgi:flagellar motor switch protein FliN/FliY